MSRSILAILFVMLAVSEAGCTSDEEVKEPCGYNGSASIFLKCWEDSAYDIVSGFKGKGVSGNMSLGPAHSSAIAAVEEKLKIRLPESIKQFYMESNGYRVLTGKINYKQRILPIQEIGYFTEKYPGAYADWIYFGDAEVSDEDYYVYGENQETYNFRIEYLKNSIVISESDDGDGMVLINPNIELPNGEFEIIFLATYLPGAIRFRSFKDFLDFDLARNLEDLGEEEF